MWNGDTIQLSWFITMWSIYRDSTEEEIRREFRRMGTIVSVESKGKFAFVEYEYEEDAQKALHYFNDRRFLGERVQIQPHNPALRSSRGPPAHQVVPPPPRSLGPRPTGRERRTDYRVLIFNLDHRVSWQDLKDFGRNAGDVNFANVFTRDDYKVGVIEYFDFRTMERALDKLHKLRLYDRKVTVEEDRGQLDGSGVLGGGSTGDAPNSNSYSGGGDGYESSNYHSSSSGNAHHRGGDYHSQGSSNRSRQDRNYRSRSRSRDGGYNSRRSGYVRHKSSHVAAAEPYDEMITRYDRNDSPVHRTSENMNQDVENRRSVRRSSDEYYYRGSGGSAMSKQNGSTRPGISYGDKGLHRRCASPPVAAKESLSPPPSRRDMSPTAEADIVDDRKLLSHSNSDRKDERYVDTNSDYRNEESEFDDQNLNFPTVEGDDGGISPVIQSISPVSLIDDVEHISD